MTIAQMKAALLAVGLALNAGFAAAAEDSAALTLKPKSAIATAVPHRWAPYVQPSGEPEREPLFAPKDLRENQSRSSCDSGRDLCYDGASGRIVYKPARALMPDIPGLTRENISVKRDKIVLRYTF